MIKTHVISYNEKYVILGLILVEQVTNAVRTHAFSLLVLCYPPHTGFLSSSFFLHGCKMAFAAFPNPFSFPLSLSITEENIA